MITRQIRAGLSSKSAFFNGEPKILLPTTGAELDQLITSGLLKLVESPSAVTRPPHPGIILVQSPGGDWHSSTSSSLPWIQAIIEFYAGPHFPGYYRRALDLGWHTPEYVNYMYQAMNFTSSVGETHAFDEGAIQGFYMPMGVHHTGNIVLGYTPVEASANRTPTGGESSYRGTWYYFANHCVARVKDISFDLNLLHNRETPVLPWVHNKDHTRVAIKYFGLDLVLRKVFYLKARIEGLSLYLLKREIRDREPSSYDPWILVLSSGTFLNGNDQMDDTYLRFCDILHEIKQETT